MSDSGFDLGLDNAQNAGVLWATVTDLNALAAAGRDAGLQVRRIDLSGCHSKAALMLRLASRLDFPDRGGRNWDALSDHLRDLSWWPGQGYMLLLDSASALRHYDEAMFGTLLEVLDEASCFWAQHGIPFWAVVGLDTPDFQTMASAAGNDPDTPTP